MQTDRPQEGFWEVNREVTEESLLEEKELNSSNSNMAQLVENGTTFFLPFDTVAPWQRQL